MTTTATNPYLKGNFAPVREEITADNLTILGELPPELSGMFVRNGPNSQFPPIGKYHWFDGDGMLHGVRLGNGKAEYRNRYIRTQGFLTEQAAGKALWTGLAQPPSKDTPRSVKNTANTALVWHRGQLLALWEGGEPYAIKLPELETVGAYTFHDRLASPVTAHPKIDPQTGEMLFFGYSVGQPPYLKYSVVSASGELLQTVPIDLPEAVMMHDFAITEHYSIFMDLPLTFSIARAQQGQPLLMFEPDKASRFGIMPRHGDNSSIRWFECPACYVVHTLNAYEDGDEVVLLACRKHSTTLGLSQKSEDSDSQLYRWRFNLSTGAVKEEMLDAVSSEFPRVNEQYLGRRTRYGYTAKFAPNQLEPRFEGLIKYDFLTGTSQTLNFGLERYGGEAVFVPRPGAVAEDDGWLLTFVHDEGSNQSELLVVNAQDITTEPVARVLIGQRVPYGFHATWVSEEQLSLMQ